MKKIIFVLIFILTVSGAVIGLSLSASSSKADQNSKPEWKPMPYGEIIRQPVEKGADRNNVFEAFKYFESCRHGYPKTYGGCYMGDDGTFVIQVTSSDLSEYQFFQDEFPCVTFEEVKYSYCDLQNLIDEYWATYDPDSETVYSSGVDVYLNRAVIGVDEETLSQKTNDPDSPIVFELGHYAYLL